eukprot:COSAG06_NODE_2858_length_6166_cov_5.402011_4_plen_58_part_00
MFVPSLSWQNDRFYIEMAPKCRFFADILLLPPSFPYGGMENPCLTFVTPTLLAVRKR